MKIGIIGCGNMGQAIANGILSGKIVTFSNVYLSDKDSYKVKELNKKFGARVSTNEEISKKCNYIIAAVKPQDAEKVFRAIQNNLDNTKHVISIMAGVTLSRLGKLVKGKVAITRAMPNMAALVGKSITCLSHNKTVKNKTVVHKIFSSVGEVIELDEKYMDAVTAVTGSGPAYYFYLSEIIRDAAVKLGIKKEMASKLVSATLSGSGALSDHLKYAPETLRAHITSKKGTTEAALKVLMAKNFRNQVVKAVTAAAKRAAELSKGS